MFIFLILPHGLLHTIFLNLPQGVSAKSGLTNLFVALLGGAVAYGFVFKYLGRLALITVFLVNLFVTAFVVTFYNAFQHVPSYRLLSQNVAEGLAVAGAGVHFFSIPFFLCALVCMFAVVHLSDTGRRTLQTSYLACGAGLLLALHALLALRVDPTVYLISNTPNGLTHRHGYYVGQAIDFAWNMVQQPGTNSRLVIADARDNLVPVLSLADSGESLPDSILLVQIESLDWQALGIRQHGREVTPFLNQLASRSAFIKLKANHTGSAGSAGADFQVMTGFRPSNSNNINLNRSFPWRLGLPGRALGQGFTFEMIHGNDATFLHRKTAYQSMG